jgi:S-ribosylhomocysteine lyase LuxS involved in autoinducer biosynthesis
MRKLSKSYTVSSRTITVNDITGFGIEDIRLIVNETKKIVIASSMQKDNITLSGTAITYVSTLAESESTDKITIEIDISVENIVANGISSGMITAFGEDLKAGKKLIASALTAQGQTTDESNTLANFATLIQNIVTGTITVNGGGYWPRDYILEEILAANLIKDASKAIDGYYYPNGWCVRFAKGATTLPLTGADRYAMSDGTTEVGTTTSHVWLDDSGDGKDTRWLCAMKSKSTSSVDTSMPNSAITINTDTIGALELLLGNVNVTSLNLSVSALRILRCTAETTFASNVYINCSNSKLVIVSLPEATSIGAYAFSNCGSLANVSLPKATSIGASAFQSCGALTSISLPKATSIGASAFSNCASLASISLPDAITIGASALSTCVSLASISLPKATSIGASAFQSCGALASISLPDATSIGAYAFQSCGALASISLPKATSIGSAFYNCGFERIVSESNKLQQYI